MMSNQAIFRSMNPYELHKTLINEYVLNFKGATKLLSRDTSKDKRDIDVIRENHKFLWDKDDADTWEKRLAKRYYDKLFKEYCICDLSKYKENKVALRWRVQQEVVIGKGQFTCGNRKCKEQKTLRTWEVNFAYVEDGEKKNALVKVRLCSDCSMKLNYHSRKKEVKRLKTTQKQDKRKCNVSETEIKESIKQENNSSEAKENPSTSEDCWQKSKELEERPRDEEFQEYLESLLM